MSKSHRLALVTGASSGIGKAFAERLAGEDYDLIVVGRNFARLKQLEETVSHLKVQSVVADLSTDEGVDLVAKVCETQEITMLVNNAGVAHYANCRIISR